MVLETAGALQPRPKNPFEAFAKRHNRRARRKGAPGRLAPMELMRLWNAQRKRCVLTGAKLKWGVTASLDHMLPLARGGAHRIGNVAFIHIDLNTWKSDKTIEEFCASVGLDVIEVQQRIADAQARFEKQYANK